jgi:hypothetical protein
MTKSHPQVLSYSHFSEVGNRVHRKTIWKEGGKQIIPLALSTYSFLIHLPPSLPSSLPSIFPSSFRDARSLTQDLLRANKTLGHSSTSPALIHFPIVFRLELFFLNIHPSQVLVPHAYNPTYSEDRNQDACSSKPAQANSPRDPIMKISNTKKWLKW